MGSYKEGSERDKSRGKSVEESLLILHNDDTNSFDHVIDS